jgi:hypothetical protein
MTKFIFGVQDNSIDERTLYSIEACTIEEARNKFCKLCMPIIKMKYDDMLDMLADIDVIITEYNNIIEL